MHPSNQTWGQFNSGIDGNSKSNSGIAYLKHKMELKFAFMCPDTEYNFSGVACVLVTLCVVTKLDTFLKVTELQQQQTHINYT